MILQMRTVICFKHCSKQRPLLLPSSTYHIYVVLYNDHLFIHTKHIYMHTYIYIHTYIQIHTYLHMNTNNKILPFTQ